MVLLVVGLASRKYISTHKRLREFTEEDFDRLLAIATRSSRIVVTPHILTETSNLAGQIADPAKSFIRLRMKELIEGADEHREASITLVQDDAFVPLGLADAALLSISVPDCTVWTTDLDLWALARKRGANVENFNHLRGAIKLT